MAEDFEKPKPSDIPEEMMQSDAERAATLESEKSPEEIEAERINRENEAKAVQEMVKMGLITAEEAPTFDFDQEIEIPEALLSEPPELSERLREYVMSKFSSEGFLPENIAGTVVHGTSIYAIRPIWLGEGETRTSEGHNRKEEKNYNKGAFNIGGSFSFSRLGEEGFNYYNEKNERMPGSNSVGHMPIFLVFIKDPNNKERSEEISNIFFLGRFKASEGFFKGATKIKAVVLAKPEQLSAKAQADQGEEEAKKIIERRSGDNLYQVDKKPLYLTLEQETNYIARCMVHGVDKSKIVPIYDWDGNLLWPKEKKEETQGIDFSAMPQNDTIEKVQNDNREMVQNDIEPETEK